MRREAAARNGCARQECGGGGVWRWGGGAAHATPRASTILAASCRCDQVAELSPVHTAPCRWLGVGSGLGLGVGVGVGLRLGLGWC